MPQNNTFPSTIPLGQPGNNPTNTVGQTKISTALPSAEPIDTLGNDVAINNQPGFGATLSFLGPTQSQQNFTQGQILAWVLGGFVVSILGTPSQPVTISVWLTDPANVNQLILVFQTTIQPPPAGQSLPNGGQYIYKFDRGKKFIQTVLNPQSVPVITGGYGFQIVVSSPGGACSTTISIMDKWTEFV